MPRIAGSTIDRDDLPEETSLAIELRALANNWLLTADTKIREALITSLLNKAVKLANKETLTDIEFHRLMKIFQTLSITEQRQQRLLIDKVRAIKEINTSDLPQQVNINVEGDMQVEQVPAWKAVRQLLDDAKVREALTGKVISPVANTEPIDLEPKNESSELLLPLANQSPDPV
jgi:hypothetical protein